jgi:endonuclease YncB( thermonuclease family)
MTRAFPSPIPCLLAIVFLAVFLALPTEATASTNRPPCVVVRVVDGDTVDLDCLGEGRFRARLTGYDTPETHNPRCSAEAVHGQAATQRLRTIVANARRIEATLGRWDRYERRLVQLSVDGHDVGQRLIAEGLALPYDGGRRPDWCAQPHLN